MPTPRITPLPRARMPERWRAVAETAEAVRGESTLIEVLAQDRRIWREVVRVSGARAE